MLKLTKSFGDIASLDMGTFDGIRQHLERSLETHSPGEVVAYLEEWAHPGRELVLMLRSAHVEYPSLADLPGRHGPEDGIRLPWMFSSEEAADVFCLLVERTFASVGAKCRIGGG
jgi:hypothetical protein